MLNIRRVLAPGILSKSIVLTQGMLSISRVLTLRILSISRVLTPGILSTLIRSRVLILGLNHGDFSRDFNIISFSVKYTEREQTESMLNFSF